MTDIHAKICGEIPADQPIRGPIGRRRKSLRHHFCDGIEAEVKAEPDAFANTKPRTMLGLTVHSPGARRGHRALLPGQARGLIPRRSRAQARRGAAEMAGVSLDNSQGDSEAKPPSQPKWNWSEDGMWDSSLRADDAKAREEQEQSEARAEALRLELGERFRRALEAERINTERWMRMELEREGRCAAPETAAASFSGNIPPAAARDPHAGTVRIGGRIVEG